MLVAGAVLVGVGGVGVFMPMLMAVAIGVLMLMAWVFRRSGCLFRCVQGLLSCKAAAGASQWS